VSVLTSRHSKTFNLSLSKATLAMAILYLLTNSDPSPVINFEINELSVYFLQHIDNNSIMQQIVLKQLPQVNTICITWYVSIKCCKLVRCFKSLTFGVDIGSTKGAEVKVSRKTSVFMEAIVRPKLF